MLDNRLDGWSRHSRLSLERVALSLPGRLDIGIRRAWVPRSRCGHRSRHGMARGRPPNRSSLSECAVVSHLPLRWSRYL